MDLVCLNIDHGLWFGSYGLMMDGIICNDSYGLWADRRPEARANFRHAFYTITDSISFQSDCIYKRGVTLAILQIERKHICVIRICKGKSNV